MSEDKITKYVSRDVYSFSYTEDKTLIEGLRVMPKPESNSIGREPADDILRNAYRKAIQVDDYNLMVSRKMIINAGFEYSTKNDNKVIIDDIQAVLEKCGLRKLSPRNLEEASLMYAFSTGLNRSEWNKIYKESQSNIGEVKAFQSKNMTYGELKNAVENASKKQGSKLITPEYTKEIIAPQLEEAISKKDFTVFYGSKEVQESIVNNNVKTLYYFNKFLLSMIENEITVLLNYIKEYDLVDANIIRGKSEFSKTAIDYTDYSQRFFGETIMSLDKTHTVINKHWNSIKELSFEDFEECDINYTAIANKFSEFLGYSNITHPIFRALHDMEGGDSEIVSDVLPELTEKNINACPENTFKYYVWWNKMREINGDYDTYKENFLKDEDAFENAIKGFRSRIRILFSDYMENKYQMPDNLYQEFSKEEFDTIFEEWSKYYSSLYARDQKTTKRIDNMLIGKKAVSRYYLALFGVFTGNNIEYLNNCLEKCGYKRLESGNDDYDTFIINLYSQLDGVVFENTKTNLKRIENDDAINYAVRELRKSYVNVFSDSSEGSDSIKEKIYYSRTDGNPIIDDLYKAARKVVYKYESDIAAASNNYKECSIYGIVSNKLA